MTGARRRALLLVLAMAAVAATGIALWARARPSSPHAAEAAAERPRLLLLTSLPLMFGEGFSLQSTGSPALAALQKRFRVVPVSTTAPGELAKGGLLLMAQPPAQTAEDLVALDSWMRRGGRLLLLADPMLEWPSAGPLGDPLRPAPMFMDTGLLNHWGLRLDAPDRRGPARMAVGGFTVLTVSPGVLAGRCAISSHGLVARCAPGKGRAVIVADADLLDVGDLGEGARDNLPALIALLESLRRG